MAIDIGADAINRGTETSSPGWTYIDKTNPANESGTITTVEIYANLVLENCIVGTFYVLSGNTLKCRDSVVIGSVARRSKQTFSGLSLTVEAGDYIGFYASSGSIDRDTTGYGGNWRLSSEHIDPGDEATYGFLTADGFSLYGTSGEGGDVTIIVPLATADGAGIAPSMNLDRQFDVPLATVSSTGLAPTMALDRIFSVPLATATSEGLVPTFVLEPGILVPLGVVEIEGLTPTLGLDVIFAVPLATITVAGLTPQIFVETLGVLMGRTLKQHDEDAGYPYMYPITYDGEVDVRDLKSFTGRDLK